ncbi:putative reverse transcriptase - house mosquito [Penaeus vannamei]|uniref:Putative reverse transcriptase-house mosquito n=1 Tax=Penaeus vannamei TaxID=6689 RepID=A0A3R7PEW0_PENVA|nr:putative reverse transcriptase - house mosquito [Penaeus vannamei]
MAKIKIKVLGGPSPRKRDLLANALYGAEIRVLRYIAIQDGYLALIDDDIQAEKLFSKDVVLSLEKLGFSPVLPVDMKAKLTLVFKKLDRQVVNESPSISRTRSLPPSQRPRSVRTSSKRPLIPIHLALPDNLSKEILVVLLHAHLQNLIAPEKGFRHHAKAALANNNLPDLDLGDSNSWGILKVIEPPTMTIQAPPEPQPQRPQPPQVQAPPQPQRPQPSQVQAPQPQPQRPQTVRVQVQEPQPAQMSEPQPAEAQTAAPQSSPQESSPTSAPPTTGPSVRPKYIHIPSEAETRDILSDTPLDTPGPPPPTPDQTEPGHSHVDDEGGWNASWMGLPQTLPTTASAFAENPKKYEYSDRYEIGQEIINKRIKWLLTKEACNRDLLAVEVNTPQGPIILATLYIPPRRQYIPEPDILQLLRHNKPIYIMGDFNAHHTLFGYNDTNAVGRGLASYIQQGRLTHLGPHTPTYIAHNAATTPDIVLANHIAHLHYHITTDDVTSSDHLPVIITLSTNPIMTPTQPRESFKHANWEGFKQALENTQVIDLEGQPTHMINNHLEQWYTDIQTAREANIPKTTYKTIPHYRETHHLKLLKIQYRHLHELSITRGWDAQLRTRYREIQTQLTHEVRVMSNQHWETLARKLCQNTKDPKKFWSSFKMLMGSNRQTVSYIYNAHRQRVNSVEGMEALHREFWQQNFQISPAENARFDNTTETEVTNYLQQHRNLTLPENIITLNNLTEDSPLSTPITPEEIINTIKHTKNTTPGASNINKTIIEHLPPTMIRKLRHIFNACLATGYFPDKFKHATITLIAKSGKGTESAIALAYEEIALGLANKHQINIILRDVSKAFDKDCHNTPGIPPGHPPPPEKWSTTGKRSLANPLYPVHSQSATANNTPHSAGYTSLFCQHIKPGGRALARPHHLTGKRTPRRDPLPSPAHTPTSLALSAPQLSHPSWRITDASSNIY